MTQSSSVRQWDYHFAPTQRSCVVCGGSDDVPCLGVGTSETDACKILCVWLCRECLQKHRDAIPEVISRSIHGPVVQAYECGCTTETPTQCEG